jgi:hypothetical protein
MQIHPTSAKSTVVHEILTLDVPGLQGPDGVGFGALAVGASLQLKRAGYIIEETIKVVERLVKPDVGHVELFLTVPEGSGAILAGLLYFLVVS